LSFKNASDKEEDAGEVIPPPSIVCKIQVRDGISVKIYQWKLRNYLTPQQKFLQYHHDDPHGLHFVQGHFHSHSVLEISSFVKILL
jgi:hypothetical protein